MTTVSYKNIGGLGGAGGATYSTRKKEEFE